MAEALYSLRGIRRWTEKEELLLDLGAMEISRGEFIVLSGRNGAGKTLFLRYLLGLESAGEYEVMLRGKKLKGVISQTRDAISYMAQHPENFFLGITVEDDLLFSADSQQSKQKEALLERFGLLHLRDRPAVVLSGGEKRRLALASALITQPEMLILDEPFSELDYEGVKELITLLAELHAQGVTVLLVTHDLSKILHHATRLMVFDAGRLVFDDSPEALELAHERFGIRVPRIPLGECSWQR